MTPVFPVFDFKTMVGGFGAKYMLFFSDNLFLLPLVVL